MKRAPAKILFVTFLSLVTTLAVTKHASSSKLDPPQGDAEKPNNAQSAISISSDTAVARSAANSDWLRLLTGNERLAKSSQDDHFKAFAKEVEYQKQWLRSQGLEFWQAHPNDARRYHWLLLTVHLPPNFPEDMDDWAEKERIVGPNLALRDENKIEQWNRVYPKLRDEFWVSDTVTDWQRKYLQLGELYSQFNALVFRSSADEEIDLEVWFQGVHKFFEAYPNPMGPKEQQSDFWYRQRLLHGVFQYSEELGLDASDELAFYDRLRGISDYSDEFVDYFVDWRTAAQKAKSGKPASSEEWQRTYVEGRIPGSPYQEEELYVYLHQSEYVRRRARARGPWLLENRYDIRNLLSIESVSTWLQACDSAIVHYFSDFDDGVFDLTRSYSNNKYVYDGPVDDLAMSDWTAARSDISHQISTTIEESSESEARLAASELRSTVNQLVLRASSNQDMSAVLQAKRDVEEFHNEFDFYAKPYVYGPAKMVAFQAKRLGMDLRSIVQFLESFGVDSLADLASGLVRREKLRTTPLDLVGTTLEGSEISLSKYRGSIVLVIFWSTNCASCIAAMPDIQATYDKHRTNLGFEIVAFSFDGTRNRRLIERYRNEIGWTWQTVNAESEFQDIDERFGFGREVPQYFLLDRDGRLVAETADIAHGTNLELLLREIVAAETLGQKAATVRERRISQGF